MSHRMSRMAVARPSPNEQLRFLAPNDAAVLDLVRENLRLLAELRSSYRAAGGETNGRIVRSAEDVADLLAPEMEALTQEQLRVVLLDTRNRVLDVLMIYQGNVNSTWCAWRSCSATRSSPARRTSSSSTTTPLATRRRPRKT